MSQRPVAAGRLYVVATPIGNLEDITLRALRVLGEVPVIAAEDTRAAQHLLTHHRVRAGQPVAKVVSFFTGNEAARTAQLLETLRGGEDVALISEAGLPGVSDPGQRLVAAVRAAGLAVEVIPGACAAVTALVGSGLPSDRFLFVGFPPRKEGERQQLLAGLRHETGTLIFYEAPDRVPATLATLAAVFGPQRPACVARELTKVYEEYASGSLRELLTRYSDSPPRGEVTILVGGASPHAATTIGDGSPNLDDSEPTAANLEAAIRQRLASGQGPREIAAALALLSPIPRRKLYQLAVALRPLETTEGVPTK
jgi:16S rRNA (cytidine1402-2'-O)-methyltransferase